MFEEREIHLREYLKVLLKRQYTVYTFFGIVFALTLIVTFSVTPVYLASTKVLIEKNEPANLAALNYGYSYDPEFNETQYQLIKSFSVAQRVVRMLSLDRQSANSIADSGKSSNIFTGTFRWFRDLFSTILHLGGTASRPSPAAQTELREEEMNLKAYQLAKAISGSIIVTPVKNSKLVNISYMSADPKLAAHVVNTVAKAYIDEVLEIRMSSSQYAMKWMTEKAEEERTRLRKAEIALQEYMKDKDIATLENKLTMVPERVSEVATKLAISATKRKELEALYSKVKDYAANPERAETIPVIAADPTIQSLRSQILKAEQNILDLSNKYGQKHPAMVTAQEDLRGLKERMKGQILRVSESIRNEYEIARASEENLQQLAGQTKAETLRINEKFVQYGVLKREVETSKELFDAIVKRIKEQGITQDIQTVNVWVVEKAEVPTSPAKPNKMRNVLLGIIVGLIGGIGLAFFIEYLDNTVKSPEEIEERFGVPVLGLIELLKAEKGLIEDIVLKDPHSHLAENYRVIRTNIILSSPDSHPKNILITSISAQEGKTATSVNLALVLAQSDHKVLIVDADLRRPRIHKIFGIENATGLSSYLAGASDIEFFSVPNTANLHIIPSGPVPPNPSELISSNRMRELLSVLQEKFDFIIWDSPPLFTVAESLVLSKLLDGTIIVAKAGSTTYEDLNRGIKSIKDIEARILGVVINGLDIKETDRYYNRYYGYYYTSAKDEPPRPLPYER